MGTVTEGEEGSSDKYVIKGEPGSFILTFPADNNRTMERKNDWVALTGL